MRKEELKGKVESRILDMTVDYPNVTNLCYEAKRYGFVAVQIFPCMIELCQDVLEGSDVAINSVISYPHGGFTIEQKAAEIREVVSLGVQEVEVVFNTREAKSHHWDYIRREMEACVKAAEKKALVKMIIEIECLTDEEAVEVCKIAVETGVDYIVTSTGLYHALDENHEDILLVANKKDVSLIKSVVGDKVKIQAQGYISTPEIAAEVFEAGADRITTEFSKEVYLACE